MIHELIRAKITETKTHLTTKTGLWDIADKVQTLECVRDAASAYLDSQTPENYAELVACLAQAEPDGPSCANPQNGQMANAPDQPRRQSTKGE